MEKNKYKFAFLGTDHFSVTVLQRLKLAGFVPGIVIAAPDKPSGRGQHIQKPQSKIWAEENSIKVLQPTKLDADFVTELKKDNWDFFVVASYGKIIPQAVLDIPKLGTLNVHPSLLPMYRGASPVESAMLDDVKETGVTILLVDAEMDHGPILSQEFINFEKWPTKLEVEEKLATLGGDLLAQTIPPFISGDIIPQDQDHGVATFTKKIAKEDGLIKLGKDWENSPTAKQYENFLKIQALNPWPGAYFFTKHAGTEMRVKITAADFIDDKLRILKVIPEGRKEMSYADFEKGFLKN